MKEFGLTVSSLFFSRRAAFSLVGSDMAVNPAGFRNSAPVTGSVAIAAGNPDYEGTELASNQSFKINIASILTGHEANFGDNFSVNLYDWDNYNS